MHALVSQIMQVELKSLAYSIRMYHDNGFLYNFKAIQKNICCTILDKR